MQSATTRKRTSVSSENRNENGIMATSQCSLRASITLTILTVIRRVAKSRTFSRL